MPYVANTDELREVLQIVTDHFKSLPKALRIALRDQANESISSVDSTVKELSQTMITQQSVIEKYVDITKNMSDNILSSLASIENTFKQSFDNIVSEEYIPEEKLDTLKKLLNIVDSLSNYSTKEIKLVFKLAKACSNKK